MEHMQHHEEAKADLGLRVHGSGTRPHGAQHAWRATGARRRLGVVVEAVAVVAAAPLAAAAPLRAAAPVLPALGGHGGGARVKPAAVATEGLRRGCAVAAKGTARRATQQRRARPGRRVGAPRACPGGAGVAASEGRNILGR
jgi:hypothetical protein